MQRGLVLLLLGATLGATAGPAHASCEKNFRDQAVIAAMVHRVADRGKGEP